MPRFKHTDYNQIKMIPVDFKTQLSPGTFEHALDYLIEEELDLSVFDHRYNNDHTGATAYDPKVLLKIVLAAYSRGVISSRQIEQLCRENIIFMALSCDSQPHFTTIADFISKLHGEIETIFADVLVLCDSMGLIGRQMFAIDGCKISSNASKEWSGTRKKFEKKKAKMEKEIRRILKKHRDEDDQEGPSSDQREREEQKLETMKRKVRKYKEWLDENPDKKGTRNNTIQSNITDNDSAKLKTVQGYSGIAVSDQKYQVVLSADVIGSVDERPSVEPMVHQTRSNLTGKDPFKLAKFAADSGFCSEETLKFLLESGIDAYVADQNFRKRDERFKEADQYYPKERTKLKTAGKFTPKDFHVNPETLVCTCPAGKRMWLKSRNPKTHGRPVIHYQAYVEDCKCCSYRKRCLRREDQATPRQFAWFQTHLPEDQKYTKRMQRKIDTDEGKHEYSKRLGIIEPVFANITRTLGLNRFSFRGKKKVSAQWKLFCLVHNIGKIQRYGLAA